MPANTVNPSLISSIRSPSPSTSASSPSPSVDGPPRKRPRSEMTSEERKEARAHRNRIAAQNSRDRRKAHFGYLEKRVAELEEENRRLRAGHFDTPVPVPRSVDEELEREKAREKENADLRERIRTLEKGWDAVVKALAAQGLPTGIPLPLPSAPSPSPSQEPAAPVIVPNTTTYPLSPAPSDVSLSHTFDFEFNGAESDSTRQLAAGGSATNHHELSVEVPTNHSTIPETETVSDAAMENLFREILASPTSPAAPISLPLEHPSNLSQFQITSAPAPTTTTPMMITESIVDWESEVEMQRLLDMLPEVQASADSSSHAQTALEFDLESEWDLERTSTSSASIGVF